MQSWQSPDPSSQPLRLDQWLEVEVAERRGAWARIVCSNGWSAWVDGRLLLELEPQPTAGPAQGTPAGTAPGAPAGTAPTAVSGRPAVTAPAASLGIHPTPQQILVLAAGVLVAVASLLPWLSVSGLSSSAHKVPFKFLFSTSRFGSSGGVSVGLVLVLLGAAGVVAMLLPQLAALRRIIGSATVGIAILYTVQLSRALKGTGASVMSALGFGTYAAVGGGLVLMLVRTTALARAIVPAARSVPAVRSVPAAQSVAAAGPIPAALHTASAAPAQNLPSPATRPAWAPTHVVPSAGMRCWTEPDPAGPVIAKLDARLEIQVVERRGAWARIVCSNGWSAWVDGRELKESAS